MDPSNLPDFIDIVVEIVDGDVYITTNIPNDVALDLTVYDYDLAERVSLEEAQAKTSDVESARGDGAIMACHHAWHDYVNERSIPLVP